MFKPLLTLGACLLAAACANAAPEKSMDATITLLPAASATLAPTAPGATLHFDRIEDSRCPPDARCITAGKLRFHFTLSASAGHESFALDKEAPSFSPAKLPGLKIALAPLDPPPARPSSASGPAPAIAVTLNISRP